MTTLREVFTMKEYLSIKEMVLALWEANLDELNLVWSNSKTSQIKIPITKNMLMESSFPGGPIRQPRFHTCTIEINRWLLPWRLKAGYDLQHNILVIQEHSNEDYTPLYPCRLYRSTH